MTPLFPGTIEHFAETYRKGREVCDNDAHYRRVLASEIRKFADLLDTDRPVSEWLLGLYDTAICFTPTK